MSCSCSGPGSFLTLQAKVAAGQAYAWLTGQSSWTAQTEAGREEAEGGSLASRAKNSRKGRERKGSVADADSLFSSFVGSRVRKGERREEGRRKKEESTSVT